MIAVDQRKEEQTPGRLINSLSTGGDYIAATVREKDGHLVSSWRPVLARSNCVSAAHGEDARLAVVV